MLIGENHEEGFKELTAAMLAHQERKAELASQPGGEQLGNLFKDPGEYYLEVLEKTLFASLTTMHAHPPAEQEGPRSKAPVHFLALRRLSLLEFV